jgi:hypothetical protein
MARIENFYHHVLIRLKSGGVESEKFVAIPLGANVYSLVAIVHVTTWRLIRG